MNHFKYFLISGSKYIVSVFLTISTWFLAIVGKLRKKTHKSRILHILMFENYPFNVCRILQWKIHSNFYSPITQQSAGLLLAATIDTRTFVVVCGLCRITVASIPTTTAEMGSLMSGDTWMAFAENGTIHFMTHIFSNLAVKYAHHKLSDNKIINSLHTKCARG